MGRKSQYDFKEIGKLRTFGLTMSEIAERLGYGFRNMERAYYRWIDRNKTTDTMTVTIADTTDTKVVKPIKKAPKVQKEEESTTDKYTVITDDLRTSYRVITGKSTRKGFYVIRDELVEILKEL